MVNDLIESLHEAGINFVAALPSSSLAKLQEQLSKDDRFTMVFVASEGEGAAICGGAWLAGKKPVLIMEDTGITFVSYTILRFHAPLGIPMLMVLDYRGDHGDGNWWAVPFGWALQPILNALRVPFAIAQSPTDFRTIVPKLWKTSLHSKYPAAVIFRYGMKVTE